MQSFIGTNNLKMASFLLNKGADVNFQNKRRNKATSLHLAAINGHSEIAKLLIANGATNSESSDYFALYS